MGGTLPGERQARPSRRRRNRSARGYAPGRAATWFHPSRFWRVEYKGDGKNLVVKVFKKAIDFMGNLDGPGRSRVKTSL
jgi:hypothetical protein